MKSTLILKVLRQQVTSVSPNEEKEHGYEVLCKEVNLMDSPQIRLLAGLLSINAWKRANRILQCIGRHAGIYGFN